MLTPLVDYISLQCLVRHGLGEEAQRKRLGTEEVWWASKKHYALLAENT